MSRLDLIETIKSLNDEDLEWLKIQITDLQTLRNTAKLNKDFGTIGNTDDTIEIYVDGSFNQDTEEYAYGVTVLLDEPMYFRKKFAKSPSSSMRNVAGEIEAARFAIQFAVKHNFKKCRIVYDYQGIEMWATGKWKANKPETKAYKEFFELYKDKCDFEFRHVKGHTGIVDNEICDALAKSVLGIATAKKYNEAINKAITN